MKTLNYFAVLIVAIIFSVSFNTISSGSQQISECPYCDVKCAETGCCDDHKNSSQGNSIACNDKCANDNCKESCSAGNGSSMKESTKTDINEQSSDVNTVMNCSEKNSSGSESKNCCK